MEEALPEAVAGFLPEDAPTMEASRQFEAAFGITEKSTGSLIVRRAQGLNAEDFAFLERYTKALIGRQYKPGLATAAGQDWPRSVRSPTDKTIPLLAEKFLSKDKQAAIVQVALPYDIVSLHTVHALDEMRRMVNRADPPAGLEYNFTGDGAVGRDYAVAGHQGLDATLKYTLIGIVLVLLFVYRSPAAVVISLATVFPAVVVSFQAAALMAMMKLPVAATTKQFLLVLLWGVGTDFCLFLFARYREELAEHEAEFGPADGAVRRQMMARAVSRAAPAVLASAATVSIALGTMVAARFQAYACAGPALAVGVLIVTAAAITLAPALMLLAGRGLFWPAGRPNRMGAFAALWDKVGAIPARHPGACLAGVLLVFTPFFIIAAKTEQVYDTLQDLPPDTGSVIGEKTFRAHFTPGEAFPVRVMVRGDASLLDKAGKVATPEAEAATEKIAAALKAELSTIADVRNLRDPFGPGDRDRYDQLRKVASFGGLLADRVGEQAAKHYIGGEGRATRMEVIFNCPPYRADAMETITRLQDVVARAAEGTPLAGARVYAMGTTPTMQDIRSVTGADLRHVAVLVGIALLVILLILLHDPLLSVSLILATVAGYFATLGLAAVCGHALLHLNGLDWKVEFFLFCILVAVGQDYNIFMVSRIMEESRSPELAGLDPSTRAARAVRSALVRTGGIISCCGVVMAVTFGSMMAAPLNVMKQIGFALGAGVLIDSFVIRPLLVPAAYMLLQRLRGGGAAGRRTSDDAGGSGPSGEPVPVLAAPPPGDNMLGRPTGGA